MQMDECSMEMFVKCHTEFWIQLSNLIWIKRENWREKQIFLKKNRFNFLL